MIRLPENVDQVRGERMTLRFASTRECGYKMLIGAGSARLAHRMIALDREMEGAQGSHDEQDSHDEYDEPGRTVTEIQAEKDAAIAALNASRFGDGEGQHCLVFTVGDAISLVSPIEEIKEMSAKGVHVDAHDFTTDEVERAATDLLARFERGIQQIAEAAVANVRDLGMFLPAADADTPSP